MTSSVTGPAGFTVGICATGPSSGLAGLVGGVLAESDAHALDLKGVTIVASECPRAVRLELMAVQARDPRIHVVLEEVRHGKAAAVNKILARTRGQYMVMVNADATPEAGAIPRLLSAISADPRVGVVSAMPVVRPGKGVSSLLVDMIWSTHNESSRLLNHMGLSNHASEELAAFRLSAIGMLPRDLVNDGAFLAQTVRRKGYSVKFSESARVHIETPGRVSDLIAQRRRILFGHAQVWSKAGSPPKTIESLLFLSPKIGFRLLGRVLARNPRFLLILPVAFVTEVSAGLLSIADTILSTKKHVVWRRFT